MPWTYPSFSSLQPAEKRAIVSRYEREFRDFDNDIIVNSALEVLRANGITDVNAIQVGPERVGEAFDLWLQLVDKVSNDKRYTILSLPTFGGRHSIAVVIDTQNRECHVIDSLNQFYSEARGQIQTAIDYGVLDGYRVIAPSSSVVQQNDSWSCGIHSAANMVGIITGDINLKTNAGISPRDATKVTELLGIFSKAYAEISVKRANELDNPRLNARQKRTVRYALEAIVDSGLDGKIKSDIGDLIEALSVEMDPLQGITDAELRQQRPFAAFLNEFSEKKPGNTLVSLLNTADFAQNLPVTMQDNIEVKTTLIQDYLVMQLLARQEQVERGVASSSSPVEAEVFNLETALTRFVTPITNVSRQKTVEHAMKYFNDMTIISPGQFNEIACGHIASHSDPIQLACALIKLGSVEDPRFETIAALAKPINFWTPAVSQTNDDEFTVRGSSYQSSSSSAPVKEKELTTEFIQFLSSIPKSERNGMQVRDYWSVCTPEEKKGLETRFTAENQRTAVSHSSSGVLGFFGTTAQTSSRPATQEHVELLAYLQTNAQLFGFTSAKELSDEILTDLTREFYDNQNAQGSRPK